MDAARHPGALGAPGAAQQLHRGILGARSWLHLARHTGERGGERKQPSQPSHLFSREKVAPF